MTMKAKPTYEELERRVQELKADYSQLEEKLQVADFFSEEIMRYMTEGLVLTDVRETVVFVNQRLSDMLGYLPEQLIGKCWLDMVSAEQQTIAQEAVARRAQKHIDRYEIILRHKDGHNVPVLIGAGPRFDKNSGEFIGTMGVVNDITERKHMEETLREKANFLQNIIDTTSDLVSVTDMEGNFTFIGPSHSILGYELDLLVGRNVMELVHPDDYQKTASAFADFITNREDGRKVEYRCRRIDGDYLWFETIGKFILDDTGNPKEILFRTRDFTARKRTEEELKRIEWMLSRKPISNIEAQTKNHDQGYGDLTELNRDGIILKSIGHERLKNFANDYLELLGTSSAIYEVNGDYAFGIFTSGWCRMMDSASRKLCNTPDNVEAFNSGRWLCHESCWTDCSKEAITKRAPVDIECKGGIRLYAVPIFANGDVIGVINFGYGDPPKDPEKLKILAVVYHLNQDDLLREATAYDSRPPYIIEMAKKRLSSTAKLIGSMVETKKAMETLRDREESLQAIFDNSPSQISEFDLEGRYIRVNHAVAKLLERHPSELVGKSFNEILPADTAELFMKRVKLVSNTCKPITVEDHLVTPEGDRHFITTVFPLIDASGRIRRVGGIANDITERKQAEEALRESETRYKALHNASFGGIAIHDQGIILECNQGLSEMTGYEYTELIGMNGLLLIAERSRESVMNNIQNRYEKSYEAFGLRKNGEEFPIRLEARNIPYKGKQVRTVEFRDITERKKAEEALRSEVTKFQTLVENTVDWVWQLDPTGHYKYVSPLAEKLIGYSVEEILGKSPFDFMSPSEAERIMPIFSKIQEKRERIVGLEDTLIAKDGTIVTFETNAAPLFGKEGDFIGYMGTCRDITERKLTEKALRESEEKYRLLFNTFPLGITVSDPSGNIVESNARATELLGIAKTEHETRRIDGDQWRIIRSDGTPKPAEEWASVRALHENRQVENTEMGIVKPGEQITWINVTAAPLPLENYGVVITYNDITDKKEAEAALKNREYLLNKVFDVLPIGLWFADKNGKLIRGNPAGVKIWGAEPTVSMEEYDVFKARRLPSGKEIAPDDWALAHTIRDGVTIVDELLEIDCFDGKKKIILNYTAPVHDDRGNIQGAIVVNHDITERERLQAQLNQAQKMESVGRLAGGVAHDFNNMLGVILGHTEMALDEIDPSAPLYANLHAVHQAAERSADLTRQLLTFARKQTIAPKVINLNKTIKGMLKMLHRLIGEDIDLLWKPGRNLTLVKVDPSQVDQILVNLCVNARDAIVDTGKITIETGVVSFDKAYCSVHAGFVPGEYVLLAVSDNGCGMDQETIGHLFEPFFTTKQPGKGTGLGLASVYGAVKQNNGFINVYSEPGHGTTFRIYLPQHQASTSRHADRATAKPIAEGSESILLVEDEPAILQMATMMLKRLGYLVIAAKTPGEAIRLAHEHSGPIDLLMTDVVMPEMNGRDLAKNLISTYPRIKRLFMSGYTANVIAHHGVLDEGVHFIQKPFSSKDLGAKLREILEEKDTD